MRRRKKKKKLDIPKVALSRDRRLILIDQGPLRKSAEHEAKKGMKALGKFRAELEEFENKILPEFQRWEAVTFGALLTEERELVARLGQLQSLIEEVSMEAYFRGCHQYEAYAMVMKARCRAEKISDDDDFEQETDDDFDDLGDIFDDDGLTPEERIFHEFLRGALGLEPEFLHHSEYAQMFREFQRLTGAREHASHGAGGRGERRPPAPADKSSRIKELYRILARRLHPDSHASDPATAGLWHDLQDAYARGDVERMEILLAITDLHEGADGSRTTLFHMRQVAREFARAVAALKSRLGKARKTSAWKFRNPSTRYDMEKEMGYEINEKLIYLRGEVAGQEAVIDRWKQAPAPRPPAQRRKSAPRQSPPMPGQGMFDF